MKLQAHRGTIWQHTIEKVMDGTDGICVFHDNICAVGSTKDQHMDHLWLVLKELRSYSPHVNKDKCFFTKDKTFYCGYIIDMDGLHKSQEKVSPILNVPRLATVKQVKSFIDLVNCHGRFIPDLA